MSDDPLSTADQAMIDRAWLGHVAAGPDPADFVEAYIRTLHDKWSDATPDFARTLVYANLREFWRVARDACRPATATARERAAAVAWLRVLQQKYRDDSDEFRKRHGDPANHMASATADHWMSIATGLGMAADALEGGQHIGARERT